MKNDKKHGLLNKSEFKRLLLELARESYPECKRVSAVTIRAAQECLGDYMYRRIAVWRKLGKGKTI
jgi:hypothetical protein